MNPILLNSLHAGVKSHTLSDMDACGMHLRAKSLDILPYLQGIKLACSNNSVSVQVVALTETIATASTVSVGFLSPTQNMLSLLIKQGRLCIQRVLLGCGLLKSPLIEVLKCLAKSSL